MYGQQKVLQLLWNRGSKEQINETNIYSNSALHLACINNRKETAEWLLDLGAAIELRNKHGLTPLHLQSLTTLLRHGALVTDIDRFGSNCLHQVVLSKKKSSNVLRDILMKLIGGGVNINGLNISGCSPLHLACIHQNLKIVEHLLNLGADFNQRGTLIGSTALMEACCKSDVEIVKTLLKWGVDMTITNHHGLTALALACRFNQLESVKALIKHGSAVAFCTKAGLTPLCTAAINNNIDIALEILITPDYFPENPAKEKAFTERVANKADVQKIEDKLLQSFETTKYEKQEQLQAILNWAISNGALKLAKHCISQSPQVLQCERNGATWLHVAAQHGQHEFIQFLWVAAILQQNSQSQSPLTISINQKHKDLEGLFWNAIRQLGTTDKSYMDSHLVEANRILKALAQYETPRHEVVLNELLQQWFKGGSDEGQQGLTTLGWAVRRSQPVVVWWLLSKGGYSSGYDIESAQKLLPNPCLDPVQRLIKKLLLDPPPILDQVANPNNDDITSPPPPMNTKSPALDIQGNIVDIYTSGETVSIPYTSASIDDIIYKKGPESLMKNARRNWNQRYLDELEEELGRMGSNSSASQHEALRMASKSSEHDISDNEECSNDITGVFKFRWIHLPVNEYNSSKSKHNTDEVSELGKYIGTRHSRQIRHNPLTLDQYYYPILTDTEKRDNDQVLSKSLEKKGKQGERKILMLEQAEAENQLFRDFLAGLRKEAGEQRGQHGNESRLKSRTEQTSRNRYHIISSETELLEETRDICDELQILRSLAEDQDVVWKQAFSPSDMRDQLQYYHSCTPTDVKKSLNEMLLEAEKTTNYINDLLNLRQAEYSRVQAKDSAKQSNSIFIFTLITIVFLPLSFLSSLFALNVSDFPHESGNLVYEGWWLFPILFGVTAIVSIPAIFFAWNVNDISEWLRGRGSSTERPTAASDEKNDGTLSQQRTTKFFSKYLKLRRRRVEKNNKNTLPQHENPREAVYLEKGL
ncbi:hypothetical protein F4781DRAFT_426499 [Annulohypoxylon bovei var. microspora]|nr:hypothetical protein F4781DRAFT_426499 [Annulohypoxylon bovei var. microspora]